MNKNKNLIGWLLNVLKILGPGFIVMIADMDAGSITTAFVSGAQYGYKLILIQIILIPLLYMVQEITSRLGCVTGEGHGALIKEHFGIKWAKLTTITLLVVVFSALLSEFAGIAASGEIFGISKIYSVTFSVVVLILVASTGKYKGAENITLIVSIISLIFIPAALLSHPNYNAIFKSLISAQPFKDKNYIFLIAANVGAVIMPWMIYYQQSATVDKGLKTCNLRLAQWDTLIGSVTTQLLMIAVIILGTVTLFGRGVISQNVSAFAQSLRPLAGKYGPLLFAVGLYASSMLAAFVVSISFAWASGETWNFKHTLDSKLHNQKLFYLIYIALIVISALITLLPHISLVSLMVDLEAFNGFILPIVLGFLILLASSKKVLPAEYSYSKIYICVIGALGVVMVFLGVYSSILSFIHK